MRGDFERYETARQEYIRTAAAFLAGKRDSDVRAAKAGNAMLLREIGQGAYSLHMRRIKDGWTLSENAEAPRPAEAGRGWSRGKSGRSWVMR